MKVNRYISVYSRRYPELFREAVSLSQYTDYAREDCKQYLIRQGMSLESRYAKRAIAYLIGGVAAEVGYITCLGVPTIPFPLTFPPVALLYCASIALDEIREMRTRDRFESACGRARQNLAVVCEQMVAEALEGKS